MCPCICKDFKFKFILILGVSTPMWQWQLVLGKLDTSRTAQSAMELPVGWLRGREYCPSNAILLNIFQMVKPLVLESGQRSDINLEDSCS